jgi:hypothetical protein
MTPHSASDPLDGDAKARQQMKRCGGRAIETPIARLEGEGRPWLRS